ncbi:MAG: hypothetical protein QNK23_12260 [Crocinitomicaceae bacterium]|nr:hypothetical protein [Crocinitomicaceae bacterium]
MAFDGKEGGEITLQTGADLTENYRSNNPGATQGHFFGKDILNEILEQTGCMGIRMYYGEDGDGVKKMVLVGAKANEDDMTDLVADLSLPCPITCGRSNDLNS